MPKADAGQLERASERLGEAALDPSLWPELMDEVCAGVGALGAALLQSDVRTSDVPITESVRHLLGVYFRDGWHERDLRVRGAALLAAGIPVVSDADVTSPEEMRRHPYFNDLIFPLGLHWWAGVGFRSGSAQWALALQRTTQEGQFGDQEKGLLAKLSPRLTEVATLSTAMGRVALTSGMNALSAVRMPALAIDHFGFALGGNSAMDHVLGEDIRIKGRRLHLTSKEASGATERLIAQLAGSDNGSFEPIVIRRADKPPVILRALPVPPAAQSPFLGARAILTFSVLEPKPRPPETLLAQAFGLTPGEAKLAAALANGANLEAAADELGIAKETARTRLKSVFAKTGTHRQGELVALLARI